MKYETSDQMLADFNAGKKFVMVRHGSKQGPNGVWPVLSMKLDLTNPSAVRCKDKYSAAGDVFTPSKPVNSSRTVTLRWAEQEAAAPPKLPEAGQKNELPKPKAVSTPAGYTASDAPGIAKAAALPPPATVTPAPAFMVKASPRSDGLLTVANPDNRKFVWGA